MNKSTGRYGIVMGLALVILGTGFSSSAWADSVAATVNVGIQPWGVAVNPVTNKIYVANLYSNNVTVIDGSNNTTVTVSGFFLSPETVAVNPATNKIYVENAASDGPNGRITVIDGSNNTTAVVVVGVWPETPAVNPVTNKIYVASFLKNNVTVIDGSDNTTVTVAVATSPTRVAVNPATNKIYVPSSNNVTVIDGSNNTTVTLPVAAGANPDAVAVNPATNKIYVANSSSNNVTVIDGSNNTTATVATGAYPFSVAVNAITNKIYVANHDSNNVTVIDGSNNTTVTVAAGTQPYAIALNPVTNKIYVVNGLSNNVTVIDGSDNTTATVMAGTNPVAVAVNSATGKIYVVNYYSNNVTVIDGEAARARADFHGDRKSDILWRNQGAGATGENYLYPMDGTTILGTEGYLRTVSDQNWQIVGVGDFDGDGKADILWRNSSTGQNYIYFMDGTTIKPTEGFIRTVADQNWQVAGIGDFDGDGRDDILWRNAATGENYLYPMDGLSIKATEGYLRQVADLNWKIAGVGDFDGDGKADILWRNASSGQNYVYPMDGRVIKPSEGFIRSVADPAWQVKGVGDFDGDGKADIVWRNSSSGQNYLYPMDGTSIKPTEGYLRTVADLNWQIVAVGDYDGDGKSDILWRNSVSGQNYIYPMDARTIKPTEGYLRTVPVGNWMVQSK